MNINVRAILCCGCLNFTTQFVWSAGTNAMQEYGSYALSNNQAAYESMKELYSKLDEYISRINELKQGGNEEALLRLSRLMEPSTQSCKTILTRLSDVLFFMNPQ